MNVHIEFAVTPTPGPVWGEHDMLTDKNIVEAIARMNIEQRDTMVKELVEKWPDMANSISNMITLESMVQNQKQQEKQ